jgi:hypothetical protein
MRVAALIALVCAFVASAMSRALAAPPTSLDITAKQVDYFSNRFIVTADGNVRVRLSDGTILRGQTFAMDLKLNRYLIAGDVHLDGPSVHEVGAGFAGYPDLDRSYFLPAAGTPDRWTYFGLDFAHPQLGREQPGDAFAIPDLSQERPYIHAAGVRIIPRTNALFDVARIRTAGVFLPSPRYVVNFSQNSHFYENAFAGARLDVGVPFNGSEHSLSALHVRNDDFNGTYLAFDQHFVWDRDYLVASVNPLTQEQRQYNLVAFKHFSPNLETHFFGQLSEAQAGIINRPDNEAGFFELQVNAALRHSGLSYTEDNYYQYLLKIPENDPDQRHLEHPMNALLSWTGNENYLGRSRVASMLRFRLRSGIGFAHDIRGEGGYPNLQPGPPDSVYHYAGASLYAPVIPLPKQFSFSISSDKQRTWYNEPHHVDQTDTRASVSRTDVKRHLNYYVAYEVKNTADFWGAQQLAAYPANGDPINTGFGSYTGQAAFRGFATSRGYSSALIYSPTPYFTLNVGLSRFYDAPAPVPGAYGQPPVQFSGDLRIRVARQIQVDLTRNYYFNFADERWTPQFGIQFSP